MLVWQRPRPSYYYGLLLLVLNILAYHWRRISRLMEMEDGRRGKKGGRVQKHAIYGNIE